MAPLHPVYVAIILFIGAGTFTWALYRELPLIWSLFYGPLARYGVLALASLFSIAYFAVHPAGNFLLLPEAPQGALRLATLAACGLSTGLLIVGLLLLMRRTNESAEDV